MGLISVNVKEAAVAGVDEAVEKAPGLADMLMSKLQDALDGFTVTCTFTCTLSKKPKS